MESISNINRIKSIYSHSHNTIFMNRIIMMYDIILFKVCQCFAKQFHKLSRGTVIRLRKLRQFVAW